MYEACSERQTREKAQPATVLWQTFPRLEKMIVSSSSSSWWLPSSSLGRCRAAQRTKHIIYEVNCNISPSHSRAILFSSDAQWWWFVVVVAVVVALFFACACARCVLLFCSCSFFVQFQQSWTWDWFHTTFNRSSKGLNLYPSIVAGPSQPISHSFAFDDVRTYVRTRSSTAGISAVCADD